MARSGAYIRIRSREVKNILSINGCPSDVFTNGV